MSFLESVLGSFLESVLESFLDIKSTKKMTQFRVAFFLNESDIILCPTQSMNGKPPRRGGSKMKPTKTNTRRLML